jgi:hypothetical protein
VLSGYWTAFREQRRARPHGGITLIQRFDSALRLYVHFHSLFLDGVYLERHDGSLEFVEFAEPSPKQVADIARRTARRIAAALDKAGWGLDAEMQGDIADPAPDQLALAQCYAAAARGVDLAGDRAGHSSLRLIEQDAVQKREPVAVVAGVNVHAATAVDGRDRKRLERLCRYLARPPIAQDRLELLAYGWIQYTLKNAWRDGTRAIVLDPMGFIARLCAMIPPPRLNMIRFHGVFGPNAKLRSEVVPKKAPRKLAQHSAFDLGEAEQTHLFDDQPEEPKPHCWAWLLKKVFRVDVTVCPDCGGHMKWLDVCTDKRDIHRVLSAHGLAPRAPPQQRWVPLGQLSFSF